MNGNDFEFAVYYYNTNCSRIDGNTRLLMFFRVTQSGRFPCRSHDHTLLLLFVMICFILWLEKGKQKETFRNPCYKSIRCCLVLSTSTSNLAFCLRCHTPNHNPVYSSSKHENDIKRGVFVHIEALNVSYSGL